MANENPDDVFEKDAVEDDVFYVKDDCVVEDSDEDEVSGHGKPIDTKYVCWTKEFNSELIALSVHPTFPGIAHVAVGSRDDKCLVVDFAASNGSSDSNEGIEWISWLQDSSAVMFGGSGHMVYIWDPKAETSVCISTTDNNSCGKFCSYNGNNIAVLGGDNGHLSVVRYSNGTVGTVADVNLHSEIITCVDCHNTVQLAIAGLYDGGLYFVELSKNTVTASFLDDHEDTVEDVKFCSGSESTLAVSIGHDGKVITWDCERMVKLHVVLLSERLTRVLWVPSSTVIAASSIFGALFAIKNGKVIAKNRPHKSTVLDIAALPCSDREYALLFVLEDGSMMICPEMFEED
uniref:WD domain, G-beta repeat domain containing protein n=1 Tax=Babesia bovis TaxID=5865 RepID=S6AZ48_BABBO|nr:WD domain, G-beta repeat domain containing protein [Babesia bovis]